MIRKLSFWICAVAVLLGTANLDDAHARDVLITPVDGQLPVLVETVPGLIQGDVCTLGNVGAPGFAIENFLLPPEIYKLAIDPQNQCTACAMGFQVTSIHMVLRTSSACELTVEIDLEDAVFPEEPDCSAPGVVDCASGEYAVSLPAAGLWDIELPIECGCAFKQYIYMLGIRIVDTSCSDGSVPDLITDAMPRLCANWNNFGTGWTDLLAFFPTWPGDLLIWADATCCEDPVGTPDSSWGAIKSRYDN
ncbi:MAG TPA: hypothetical protein VGC99_19465 [Candidatus Tectomicrobia bacterium]